MLRDMEVLINKIYDDEIREYMKEALRCYNVESYKACVILSVIAGMYDLRKKINVLAPSIKEVEDLDKKIEYKIKKGETFERYMVEQCVTDKINLLTRDQGKSIGRCLDIRNECAHPGGHVATAEEARTVFADIIDILASKPISLGANHTDRVINQLKNESFYPYKDEKVCSKIIESKIAMFHKSAIIPLCNKIVKILLDGNDIYTEVHKKNSIIFIANVNLSDKERQRILQPIIEDDTKTGVLIELLNENMDILLEVDSVSKMNILSKIEKCTKNESGIVVDTIVENILKDGKYLSKEEKTRLFQAILKSNNINLIKTITNLIKDKGIILEKKDIDQLIGYIDNDINLNLRDMNKYSYAINIINLIGEINDININNSIVRKLISEMDNYDFKNTNNLVEIFVKLVGYIDDNIGDNELIDIVEKIILQTTHYCPSFRAEDFINYKYKETCNIIRKYGLLIFDNSDIFNSKIDEYIEIRLRMLNNVFDESMWNEIKMKYDEELDFYNDELRELFEKATTRVFQS